MEENVKKVIEALVLRKEPVMVRAGEREQDRVAAFITAVNTTMKKMFNYDLSRYSVGELYTNAVDDVEVIIRINADDSRTGFNVIVL